MSKKCPKCGLANLSESNTFCPKDGTRLIADSGSHQPSQTIPPPSSPPYRTSNTEPYPNWQTDSHPLRSPDPVWSGGRTTEPHQKQLGMDSVYSRLDKSNDPMNTFNLIRGFGVVSDPSVLTRAVKVVVGFYISACVFLMLAALNLFSVVNSRNEFDRFNFDDWQFSQMLNGLSISYYFLLVQVSGVVVLLWIYRTYKNCVGFGSVGLRFSPGWAVGYNFIPILSLFRPFQVMKETWNASSNPWNPIARPAPTILVWWWTLFLITRFLNPIAVIALFGPPGRPLGMVACLVLMLAEIALCIIFMRIVTEVSENQLQRIRQIVDGLEKSTTIGAR